MDMRKIDIFFKISNPRLIYVFCKICEGEIVYTANVKTKTISGLQLLKNKQITKQAYYFGKIEKNIIFI
jgi:hypothetical protein